MHRLFINLKTRIRIILTKLLGKDFAYLYKHKTSILDGISIISFDVFDTLIIREGIDSPSDVFKLVHSDDSCFISKRINAERVARARSSKEDITLREIYKVMQPARSDSAIEELIRAEIDTELNVCKANSSALAFYNLIKESGKRVIIISDMYMSRGAIETILIRNGYDLTDVNVYVSCEYGKTKRTGSLYDLVMAEEGTKGKVILHIGDNFISDFIKPRKCGMKSFLCNKR